MHKQGCTRVETNDDVYRRFAPGTGTSRIYHFFWRAAGARGDAPFRFSGADKCRVRKTINAPDSKRKYYSSRREMARKEAVDLKYTSPSRKRRSEIGFKESVGLWCISAKMLLPSNIFNNFVLNVSRYFYIFSLSITDVPLWLNTFNPSSVFLTNIFYIYIFPTKCVMCTIFYMFNG